MSAPDRRAMVERPGKDLSVRRQCALVGVARSGVYRPKPVTGADDLAVMRRIDELHLELPFYGSRRMTFELNKEGRGLNRKRVRRLMRVMGIEALVPRPGTSRAAPGHKIYRVPAARPEDCRAEPRVGGRRDLHPDGVRLPLSGGDHRLGQPGGSGMAAFEHQRCERLARRRWRRRCFGSESRGFSIPIRAPLSPPRLSPANSRRPASRFRWTDAAASWTTFSSNGCGAPSSMKRCI